MQLPQFTAEYSLASARQDYIHSSQPTAQVGGTVVVATQNQRACVREGCEWHCWPSIHGWECGCMCV